MTAHEDEFKVSMVGEAEVRWGGLNVGSFEYDGTNVWFAPKQFDKRTKIRLSSYQLQRLAKLLDDFGQMTIKVK